MGEWIAHHAHHLAPIILPITCDKSGLLSPDQPGMDGSLRQRGSASWELRVYAGIDADTRRRRYRSAAVHGNRADAERALAALVADVRSTKTIGAQSTMSELLEAWFANASTS